MKSGTLVALGFAAVTLIAGASIYYLQGYVYYEPVKGLETVEIGGQPFAVSDYDGLDNASLPLRLRGCFNISDPAAALAAGEPAPDALPFEAPSWFECWDVEQLANDLTSGAAQAVIAERASNEEFKTERLVAIYPDGRAYQWRRILETD